MIRKPALLFISPTLPARVGYGAAIRTSLFVEAFSGIYDIHFLAVNIWNRTFSPTPLRRDCFKTIRELSLDDLETARAMDQPISACDEEIHHVHVYRLEMIRFIIPQLIGAEQSHRFITLDLDDYESKLAKRLADLHAAAGDVARCKMLMDRAARFQSLESQYLHLFDQVYVCHNEDRDDIRRQYDCSNVHVVPNAVQVPSLMIRRDVQSELTLLFVGTLNYPPNEDGLSWFCACVLPTIRQFAHTRFRVQIVGSQPSRNVRRLSELPDVSVVADVPSVDEFYYGQCIAIAPIRAAGGTRIKILEALSHGCPVVSTSMGAEGLELKNGTHLLIGDTAEEFAAQCLILMQDKERRDCLSQEGFSQVLSMYSVSTVAKTIRQLIGNESGLSEGGVSRKPITISVGPGVARA